MSLIKCPECNKDVSTQATSCPHCGAPISPPQENKVVTERTSKNLKGFIVLSAGVFWWGLFAPFFEEKTNPEFNGKLMAIGFIGYIVTKIAIWWQHD